MPAIKKAPALKPRKGLGISRIDQPEKKNHTWYLRLNGTIKSFADSVWGSKRRALEAAENERDRIFYSMPAEKQYRYSSTFKPVNPRSSRAKCS